MQMKTLSSFLTGCMLTFTSPAFAAPPPTEITVIKSPTCGCCSKWEEHLRANGFTVKSVATTDHLKIKDEKKIPREARSCHTGLIGNYYVEGHVPASVLKKFLKEAPKDVAGLAVPGMPIGSPGMEMDGRQEEYDVLKITRRGAMSPYEHIR
jgi:hypothetical protein